MKKIISTKERILFHWWYQAGLENLILSVIG